MTIFTPSLVSNSATSSEVFTFDKSTFLASSRPILQTVPLLLPFLLGVILSVQALQRRVHEKGDTLC